MNAHRQLGINAANQSKSTEKLSSGFRINRAGDDAAGLAISEKMRGQIRGLNQASRNAQDGISLIQTAEGALDTSQKILQRMRELSVQAANDTNVDADREAIQNEITELTKEVDRIANTAEFNTQKLLKGTGSLSLEGVSADFGTGKLAGGVDRETTEATNNSTLTTHNAAAGDSIDVTIHGETITVNFAVDAAQAETSKVTNVTGNGATISVNSASVDVNTLGDKIAEALNKSFEANSQLAGSFEAKGTAADFTISATKDGGYAGSKTAATDLTVTYTGVAGTAGTTTAGTTTAAVKATKDVDFSSVDVADFVGKGITLNGKTVEFYDGTKDVYKGDAIAVDIAGATSADDVIADLVEQQGTNIEGVTLSDAGSGTLTITAAEGGLKGNDIDISDGGKPADYKVQLQIGANEGQAMEFGIGDMRAEALKITDADISTTEGAEKAITTFDNAIKTVSAQRAKMGAVQNRLEYTINNLDTSAENLQASESRIRDLDMAKEMMAFTKNNILNQAAQAMLAQANQAPQGVLQLLR